MKKILKYLGIIVLIVLVLLLAYIIYLFASYHRIPDNQPLQVEQTKREYFIRRYPDNRERILCPDLQYRLWCLYPGFQLFHGWWKILLGQK